MVRKTYILFDTTSGLPIFIVDLNTDISDFGYSATDTWGFLERHGSATSIKAAMADPTINGIHHYEVDRTDADFLAKGMFAFQYNTMTQQVEKVTPP